MKFLLVLAVVVVAIWIWRNNRQSEANEVPRKPPQPPALPVNMVACLQCGTHMPESDALRGTQGPYCCPEHRQQHERGSV
jgi:uncharacterized protein